MRTRGPMQEMSLPKSEGASLWDCEELALRYVIEDGKLNLCVAAAAVCDSWGCYHLAFELQVLAFAG